MKQLTNQFYVLLILTICTCLNSCNSKNNKSDNNSHKLQLSASLGGTEYHDTTTTIYISTTLYNPTADTINFLSMTCSYEDYFTVDTQTFKVQPRYDCIMNVPLMEMLPPHKRID